MIATTATGRSHARRSSSILVPILLMATALSGCSQSSEAQKKGGGGPGGAGARGPAQVGFVTVTTSNVPVVSQLGGRTVAFETSEVRPQVNGLIQRRLFTEGSFVRQGQPLYQIDPSLYRAAVNEASANVASARAAADAAQAKANRYRPLARIEAVSQQEYTDAAAQARQARAGVNQNLAALETARISLRFATIKAPISGRIGRSLFTQGALVSASQANPLAVIQRTDPIYVDIQQSSAELTALRRALAQGGVDAGKHSGPPAARGWQRLWLHRDRAIFRGTGEREYWHRDPARAASPIRRACCCPGSSSRPASPRR